MENNYSPAGNKFCIDVIGPYNMMEYRMRVKTGIFLIWFLAVSVVSSARELPVKRCFVGEESVEYEIVNDTDEDYYFWIDPSPIERMDVEVVKHIFHRFLFHPQYFEGNMSLGAIATDGNVIISPQSVNHNFGVGLSFLKRINPGSSFMVRIPGNSRKQTVYRSRFGFIPVDSCKFNKIDDQFLWHSDSLTIDKPYAEEIGLIENTDCVILKSDEFPREVLDIDSIIITSSGHRSIAGRFVIDKHGYRVDGANDIVGHETIGILDSVFEPVYNIFNREILPKDDDCGFLCPEICWNITLYDREGVSQREFNIRFCHNKYSLPVEKTAAFLRRIKFLEQERNWHKRLPAVKVP